AGTASTTCYRFGNCEIDNELCELRRAGDPVKIEPKVFAVLLYLLQQHHRLVSKEELLRKLWPNQVVLEAVLTRCVAEARKAVGDDGTRQEVIKTQQGRGYRFIAPLSTAPPVSSSKFQVPSPHSATHNLQSSIKVVGREIELKHLHGCLEKVLRGER